MSAPEWLHDLFGWRKATDKGEERCQKLFGHKVAPNIADIGGAGSLRIAGAVYEALGIPPTKLAEELQDENKGRKASAGIALERKVASDLEELLPRLDGQDDEARNKRTRIWKVTRTGNVSDYAQFRHLETLQKLADQNPAFRTALVRDYQVKLDVRVGVERDGQEFPFLHAAVSCKWSMRSDRVQNVRHEFATLVRNRRGRTPHLVLVTAEPLPTRLVSIARGTGEIDAVYHLLFDELQQVLPECGAGSDQLEAWHDMVEQQRVKPYHELASDLVLS